FLSVLSEHVGSHRDGILGSQFEDVANLERFKDLERSAAAFCTAFAGTDCSEIRPLVHRDIALQLDSANVIVVSVRSGCHVVTSAQCQISNYRNFLSGLASFLLGADRSETACMCSE